MEPNSHHQSREKHVDCIIVIIAIIMDAFTFAVRKRKKDLEASDRDEESDEDDSDCELVSKSGKGTKSTSTYSSISHGTEEMKRKDRSQQKASGLCLPSDSEDSDDFGGSPVVVAKPKAVSTARVEEAAKKGAKGLVRRPSEKVLARVSDKQHRRQQSE